MAVLLLIIILVVAASVCTWANWYIDWSNAGSAITIKGMGTSYDDLVVWVQNIGKGSVHLAEDSCLYVNGELVKCKIYDVVVSERVATLGEWKTVTVKYAGGAVPPGMKVTVNVTSLLGVSAEKSAYPAGTVREASVIDHFEFDAVAGLQTSGVPFNVTIWAVDQYGDLFTNYTDTNRLKCSGWQITPEETGNFSNGVWSGEVTVESSKVVTIKDSYVNLSITAISSFDWHCRGSSNNFVLHEVPLLFARWNATYDAGYNNRACAVVETADGGYAMAGVRYELTNETERGRYGDAFLVKTDANGNIIWTKEYRQSKITDGAHSMVVTSDGGYALAGYNFLMKTDASGNMLWHTTFDEELSVQSLVALSDGCLAVCGYTVSTYNCFLKKISVDGQVEWTGVYGGTKHAYAYSLIKTSDGGFALAGKTHHLSESGTHMYLVKTDTSGNREWSKTYEGIMYRNGTGTRQTEYYSYEAVYLVETSDGGYLLAGYRYISFDSICIQIPNFWLVKTDENGTMLWEQTYGAGSCKAVVETSDGGYLLLGSDVLIMTDDSGNVQWDQEFGEHVDVGFYSLIKTSDGGYALSAAIKCADEEYTDALLIKLQYID